MRCLVCGEEMILLETAPDSTLSLLGYEEQTFRCSACAESERSSLIFKGASASWSLQDNELLSPGAFERLIERARKQQEIRHCLACGEEMALIEAVPDDTMMVAGYEHHMLQCSACGDSERRLVFRSRRSAPGIFRIP